MHHALLLDRWSARLALGIFSAAALALVFTLSAQAMDILSPAERAWLTAHPQIRLAPEKNYPPFVFTDALGTAQGLSIDYIRKVENQLGIRFQFLPAAPLSHILPALQHGAADLHPALRETPERAAYLNFTRPYARIHTVLVTRIAATPEAQLANLHGQKVAVGDGYAVQPYLAEHFPELVLTPFADDERCLEKVRTGEVAAAVVDIASALWFIRQHQWSDLRIGADVGFTYDLRLASRRDLPELNVILDKALASIPAEEHEALLNRWVKATESTSVPDFPWTWAIPLALTIALLVGAGLLFHRRRPSP
ncbi:MAG TPA: transporter substrate-binding domain-containing protein [Candidatus Competibacteraceae bacterium]|nr:transporter substrate-binding domain-containing protein [Candidatus Competibacteraceae bacterium]HQD55309.1 transporter substrate-binding domain-containing protein [Candidatus Competibacteraceae bacterium]